MTEETFKKGMMALAAAYDKPVSGEKIQIYWSLLCGIPDQLFTQGVQTSLANSKFFPSIAELGEFCMGEQWERAAYTPWGRSKEPRKLSWREALERQKEVPQIEHSKTTVTPDADLERLKKGNRRLIQENYVIRQANLKLRAEVEELTAGIKKRTIAERKAELDEQAKFLLAREAKETGNGRGLQ